MEKCLFVHPENIQRARQELNLQVAVICRPDWFMSETGCEHLIVETEKGIHSRCYIGRHHGIAFLIVYGRFERVRTTSDSINFPLTQEAISFLGIRKVVGTFVAGSIQPEGRAGEVYIPHDYVGLGGFDQSRNHERGFRNVDMFTPFCNELRSALGTGAERSQIEVKQNGVYVCFHGFPRIETAAELNFYASQGWDVVGQTLDPEATLAREAGCHYAALVGTIDDRPLRERFLAKDETARGEIDNYIGQVRRKTFKIFLDSLSGLAGISGSQCNCVEQEAHVGNVSRNFFYRPRYLFENQ